MWIVDAKSIAPVYSYDIFDIDIHYYPVSHQTLGPSGLASLQCSFAPEPQESIIYYRLAKKRKIVVWSSYKEPLQQIHHSL